MQICELLSRTDIIEELNATSKREALEELAGLYASRNGHPDVHAVVEVLEEREKLGSTGIGNGIAIPHGKSAGIEKILVGFGRSRRGIDFNSLDGRPAHLFFMLLAPESSSGRHLKVLAKISRMLTDETFRSDLMNAASVDDLYRIIGEMDQRIF